jgi:hypothetical protein
MKILLLLLLLASPCWGTTYYVDSVNGNDNNTGTDTGHPWLTIPGTIAGGSSVTYRNGGVWGAIKSSNKLSCGDVILIKAGQTHSGSTNGGGVCIIDVAAGVANNSCGQLQGTLYPTTCTVGNPIWIRPATNAEWTGSTGNFTWDDTGATAIFGKTFVGASGEAGIFDVEGVPGIKLGVADAGDGVHYGPSPTAQRMILLKSPMNDGGILLDSGSSNVTKDMGFIARNVEVDQSLHRGIGFGDVQNALLQNVHVHNSAGFGWNCGLNIHHDCTGVAMDNGEVDNNGTAEAAFGCEAIVLQGSGGVFITNSSVHDNHCNGYNSGSADHTYVRFAHSIMRNLLLYNNGTAAPTVSAGAGSEGGGDWWQSEVGAPSHGYCDEQNSACGADGGGNGGKGAVCAADGLNCCFSGGTFNYFCSIYDAYSVFENTIYADNKRMGPFCHHGSGFTWWLNSVVYQNDVSLYGPVGNIQTGDHAGDHLLFNSIVVDRSGVQGMSYSPSGGGHGVCRYNTPNAGIPCVADSDCGASVPTGACNLYKAPITVRNTLWRPSPGGTNAESMSAVDLQCDVSCGNAGTSCAMDSDCTGCAGSQGWCNWIASSCTFTQAVGNTKCKYLNDASNLIGSAHDPSFVSTPTGCTSGSDPTTCDFHLQGGSEAIDKGDYYQVANGAGVSSTALVVKEGPHMKPLGVLDFNGHGNWPGMFWIPTNGYPTYGGDVIQIGGSTCAAGSPALPASQAIVASVGLFTDIVPTITLDRACSWSDGAGISFPISGTAPDLGPFEANVATTTTTTTPTTSTSSSTTNVSTTTTSTVPTGICKGCVSISGGKH